MFDFTYAREGPINEWKQQAIAQAFIDAIKENPDGAGQFRERLRAWNEDTQDRFLKFYWPQVVTLKSDLNDAGVDISAISRAVALDGPRKVGLMLSVLAGRIGKSPPFPRVLTPVEARAIVQGTGGGNVEVYAYQNDHNSKDVAEILRKEFAKQGWSTNKALYPLQVQPVMHGIHVIYPSADMTTELNTMMPALDACELDNSWEVRPMRQPPTIIKIEVWPAQSQPFEPIRNQLIR